MTVENLQSAGSKSCDQSIAPRTYQSAWQWNDDGTSKLMTAEEWLDEEADVDASINEGGPRQDAGPNRGGILRTIAKEIATLRSERTQLANECTRLAAQLAESSDV